MDADIVGTIGSIVSLAKTTIEALRSLIGKKDRAPEAERRVLELAESLHARLFELEKEALNLKAENGRLAEDLRRRHERHAERQRYQPTKQGAATVLLREDRPGICFCPACFDESREHPVPLQPHVARRGSFGSHMCPACGAGYRL